jgi:hypothetical protein
VAGEDWDAARFETELAPVLEAQGQIRTDPQARLGHWTQITSRSELAHDVVQVLIDEGGEGAGQIEAVVELEETVMPAGPMIQIVAIRS